MSRTELTAYETGCLQLLRQSPGHIMSFLAVSGLLELSMDDLIDVIASLRQKGLVTTKAINNIQHVRLV